MLCYFVGHHYHRRIQDFVRGGAKALLAPGGGGARPSWPAPHYLGEQYFVGRGGQGPLGPPLDPRMTICEDCMMEVYRLFIVELIVISL